MKFQWVSGFWSVYFCNTIYIVLNFHSYQNRYRHWNYLFTADFFFKPENSCFLECSFPECGVRPRGRGLLLEKLLTQFSIHAKLLTQFTKKACAFFSHTLFVKKFCLFSPCKCWNSNRFRDFGTNAVSIIYLYIII